MPWDHCGASIFDNQVCPTCGQSKPRYTVRRERTRVFQVASPVPDASAQATALRAAHRHATPFCEP